MFWERKTTPPKIPIFVGVLFTFLPRLSSCISTLSDYSPARKLKIIKEYTVKSLFNKLSWYPGAPPIVCVYPAGISCIKQLMYIALFPILYKIRVTNQTQLPTACCFIYCIVKIIQTLIKLLLYTSVISVRLPISLFIMLLAVHSFLSGFNCLFFPTTTLSSSAKSENVFFSLC